MTPAVVVGFVLALIIAVVAFCCWWSADTDLRAHDERLRVLEEAALNLGGEPLAISDAPTGPICLDTEPMPKVDLAAGVRRARNANRPKPTPFPRKGRHSA